jgi:MiAMP1
MLSHRIRCHPSALRLLAGILFALGVLAGSASPAFAATDSHAISASRAPTSSFVAFTGHDFTGTEHDISGCGGHNMPLPLGSWEVFYRGQTINMYNVTNEAGRIVATFRGNQSSSTGAGWKSLFVVC